jgi:hypothetical protein
MLPLDPKVVGTLDKMMRADLEGWSNFWFWCLVGSTIAVAIGIICEAPEVWQAVSFGSQTVDRIRNFWYIRVRRVGLNGWEQLCPELVRTNSHHGKWVIRVGFIGWTLVALGVAGEGVSEYFVNDAETNIRSFDESVLVETQGKSSAAFERAAQTEREAAQENARAAQALEAAENARRDAEGFKLQIAQANERAAQAEKATEDERLARIRLEEKLGGWKLDAAAQTRVIAKLKEYKGTPFDLGATPSEIAFMETMDGICTSAEWVRQIPKSDNPILNLLLNGKARINYVSGFYVEIASSSANRFEPAVKSLVLALRAEGIPAQGQINEKEPDASAIHIVVGSR